MKIIPRSFKPEGVRAILEGRKTQTRRPIDVSLSTEFEEIVKDPKVTSWDDDGDFNKHRKEGTFARFYNGVGTFVKVLPCTPSDILWVREAFHEVYRPKENQQKYLHKADSINEPDNLSFKWKSPIYMPKEACRLFLEVINLRVERLQDISEEDAQKEGADDLKHFREIWEGIYDKKAWDKNPWVWVYDFRVREDIKSFEDTEKVKLLDEINKKLAQ